MPATRTDTNRHSRGPLNGERNGDAKLVTMRALADDAVARCRDAGLWVPERKQGAIPTYATQGRVVKTAGVDGYDNNVVTWIISTDQWDRAVDRMLLEGANIRNYLENPVGLWCHDSTTPSISTGSNIRIAKNSDGVREMWMDKVYHRRTKLSEEVHDLVLWDVIRGQSIGFMPEELEDEPIERYPDIPYRHARVARTYTKWELLESSDCNIPMNPGALRKKSMEGSEKSLLYGVDDDFEGRIRDAVHRGIIAGDGAFVRLCLDDRSLGSIEPRSTMSGSVTSDSTTNVPVSTSTDTPRADTPRADTPKVGTPMTTTKSWHDYSCAKLIVPEPAMADVTRLADEIADEDLGPEGRAETPFITVQSYLTDNADLIATLIADQPPVRITLGETSVKAAEPDWGEMCDVVQVDLASPDILALRQAISGDLITVGWWNYHPCVTLAHVKQGRGAKYAGDKTLAGTEIEISEIEFHASDGTVTVFSLTGTREEKIADGAVTTAKLADSSISTSKVTNHTSALERLKAMTQQIKEFPPSGAPGATPAATPGEAPADGTPAEAPAEAEEVDLASLQGAEFDAAFLYELQETGAEWLAMAPLAATNTETQSIKDLGAWLTEVGTVLSEAVTQMMTDLGIAMPGEEQSAATGDAAADGAPANPEENAPAAKSMLERYITQRTAQRKAGGPITGAGATGAIVTKRNVVLRSELKGYLKESKDYIAKGMDLVDKVLKASEDGTITEAEGEGLVEAADAAKAFSDRLSEQLGTRLGARLDAIAKAIGIAPDDTQGGNVATSDATNGATSGAPPDAAVDDAPIVTLEDILNGSAEASAEADANAGSEDGDGSADDAFAADAAASEPAESETGDEEEIVTLDF